jgi:hypothetical protein
MRVRLKGLHFVKKKLAGGGVQEYVYAWRGGPSIKAAPGSPEFLQAYNDAIAAKAAPKPRAANLLSVLRAYQGDEETFGSLAERTVYCGKLELIEPPGAPVVEPTQGKVAEGGLLQRAGQEVDAPGRLRLERAQRVQSLGIERTPAPAKRETSTTAAVPRTSEGAGDSLPRQGAEASPPPLPAGNLDRPASKRPAAAVLVSLRHLYPTPPEQDRLQREPYRSAHR